MLERRQSSRFSAKFPVKLRIFDRETKTYITNYINADTKDISKGGACLVLPRSWGCPECNNCLGWMYNLGCKLKDNHTTETNRTLVNKLNLTILIPQDPKLIKKPVQLEGECVWVNADIGFKEDAYPVGIAFSKASRKKISTRLSGILSPT